MAKRKRDVDTVPAPIAEGLRARMVAAMSERDAVMDGIGANRPRLRRFVVAYARLHEAAYPITGQPSDPDNPAPANRVEQPMPGAATHRDRARLNRINRRIDRLIDEMEGEPVNTHRQRCGTCNRSAGITARYCDTCGTALGGDK